MVVLMVTMSLLPSAPLWILLLVGLGAGTAFGAVLGPASARAERAMWRLAGDDLTWQQFRTAAKASRSGRVPADSRLREAAVRLAVHQLTEHRRRRVSTLVILSLATAFNVLNAVLGSWVGLLGAAWFAAVGVVFLHERVRLGRALLRLRAAPSG
jgi:hypothetical protein